MKLIDTTCSHCGAQLKIDDERKKAFCEFCGAQLLIEDDSRNLNIDNAEDIGYQFEKGRQRAQNEARAQTPVYTVIPTPKKRHTFWWVIGWIFIFPIPVTILTARSKKFNRLTKVLIIAGVWLAYFLIGIAAGNR